MARKSKPLSEATIKKIADRAEGNGFSELTEWLATFPDQVDGHPAGVSNVGEPYETFNVGMYARPNDVQFIKTMACGEIHQRLRNYFDTRNGRIYWRMRPEIEVLDAFAVIEHRADGPDLDMLGNPCILDREWRVVFVRCRLYRAKYSTIDAVEAA